MGGLGLLVALLKIGASLIGYLEQKKLISAGEAQAISRSLEDAQKQLKLARQRKDEIRRLSKSDLDNRLRDDFRGRKKSDD